MTDNFRADLHCHSYFSDGADSPEMLIDKALSIGLSGLSITDHDSVGAYRHALPYAEKRGLLLLTGVEFSANHRNTGVHILAYAFNPTHPAIQGFCARHRDRRQERILKMLARARECGMDLSEGDLPLDLPAVGRPHLALAMQKKGYVSSVSEAFKKHLGDRGDCFIAGEHFSVEETLAVIHQASGIAVLAHPHLMQNKKVLLEVMAMDFDGIEAYYAKFPPHKEKPWVKIASEKSWLVSGGSDYHGSVKPDIPLGCSWVNRTTFEALYHKMDLSS